MIEKPQRIGKYIVQDILGKGGMGIVYKAYDPILDRQVAIKMMVSAGADAELKERFYREAQSLGTLHHRNVITIYDLGQEGENPYIAMEFLTGIDLDKVIKARQPLDLTRKLDIIRQVCDGLGCAHNAGIIHRDVKPANIRVLDDGVVKLMDFGIARMSTSATMTRSGLIMGTIHYMSPEQVKGLKVDSRSDIFAVGGVLYELLSYHKPFHADTMTSVLYRIVNDPPQPLDKIGFHPPPELDRILRLALAKDANARYQDIAQMSRDLLALIEELGVVERQDALRRRVEELLSAGKEHLEQERYQEAQEVFDHVLAIEPEHNEATGLMRTAEREWRRAWSQQLLAEARQLLAGEFFEDALLRLHEVLGLDPTNAEALSLTRQAQQREEAERRRAMGLIEDRRREKQESEQGTEFQDFDESTKSSITTKRMRAASAVAEPPAIPRPPAPPPTPTPPEIPDHSYAPPPAPIPFLPDDQIRPGLVARVGGVRAISVVLIAVALALTVFYLVFVRQPRPNPPVAAANGYLELDVKPWAQVVSVTDLSTGKPINNFSAAYTPCRLELPPGSYELQVSNPFLNKTMSITVTIQSEQTTTSRSTIEGYDRERVLQSLVP